MDHDLQEQIYFASLQSPEAEKYIKIEMRNNLTTVIFVSDGQTFLKSEAVIEVLLTLGGRWFYLAKLLMLIPVGFRDSIYDYIAKNRYRWFGRRQECRVLRQIPKSENRDPNVVPDHSKLGSAD